MRAYGGRNVVAEAAQGPSSTAVVDKTCSALIDGVLGESSRMQKFRVSGIRWKPTKTKTPETCSKPMVVHAIEKLNVDGKTGCRPNHGIACALRAVPRHFPRPLYPSGLMGVEQLYDKVVVNAAPAGAVCPSTVDKDDIFHAGLLGMQVWGARQDGST